MREHSEDVYDSWSRDLFFSCVEAVHIGTMVEREGSRVERL